MLRLAKTCYPVNLPKQHDMNRRKESAATNGKGVASSSQLWSIHRYVRLTHSYTDAQCAGTSGEQNHFEISIEQTPN